MSLETNKYAQAQRYSYIKVLKASSVPSTFIFDLLFVAMDSFFTLATFPAPVASEETQVQVPVDEEYQNNNCCYCVIA